MRRRRGFGNPLKTEVEQAFVRTLFQESVVTSQCTLPVMKIEFNEFYEISELKGGNQPKTLTHLTHILNLTHQTIYIGGINNE
jgi:hypothetical protein